jgi:hypothetical protein
MYQIGIKPQKAPLFHDEFGSQNPGMVLQVQGNSFDYGGTGLHRNIQDADIIAIQRRMSLCVHPHQR